MALKNRQRRIEFNSTSNSPLREREGVTAPVLVRLKLRVRPAGELTMVPSKGGIFSLFEPSSVPPIDVLGRFGLGVESGVGMFDTFVTSCRVVEAFDSGAAW